VWAWWGKKDEMYAKASCDFISGIVIAGEKQLVGVECKARVTPITHQREKEHAVFLSRFMSLCTSSTTSYSSSATSSPELYTVICSDSEDFHLYVASHEAVQLLHQAYVYSFKYVLLPVGDASGNIIRGASEKLKMCFSFN
jgi:hypothetical protein